MHGPFESLAALQAALDAWRQEYNTDRRHQSLGMAFPASRFAPAVSPLRVPPQLARAGSRQPELPSADPPEAAVPDGQEALVAVETDRVVPSSGNLWIGGQQVWLSPQLADRKVTIWVDETSLHVLLDGARIKTLPSRLGITELARLAASGARPAGPSPLLAGTGSARSLTCTGVRGAVTLTAHTHQGIAPSTIGNLVRKFARCDSQTPRSMPRRIVQGRNLTQVGVHIGRRRGGKGSGIGRPPGACHFS